MSSFSFSHGWFVWNMRALWTIFLGVFFCFVFKGRFSGSLVISCWEEITNTTRSILYIFKCHRMWRSTYTEERCLLFAMFLWKSKSLDNSSVKENSIVLSFVHEVINETTNKSWKLTRNYNFHKLTISNGKYLSWKLSVETCNGIHSLSPVYCKF